MDVEGRIRALERRKEIGLAIVDCIDSEIF